LHVPLKAMPLTALPLKVWPLTAYYADDGNAADGVF
jgi:hypothetical protein